MVIYFAIPAISKFDQQKSQVFISKLILILLVYVINFSDKIQDGAAFRNARKMCNFYVKIENK